MRSEDFTTESPGAVVRSVQGHWTFFPNRLPPTIIPNLELMADVSAADQALGELAGAGRWLPNPHLLIRPFIRREAVLSSKIEGTVTRLDQLFLFEANPDELSHPADAHEVQNYVAALEHGLNYIRGGRPFSLQLLREVHEVLMRNVRGADKRPGQIRDRAVLIGSSNNFDEARFIPPCQTQLMPLLNDFIDFLRNGSPLPIVLQLALMHYQFETIHPFNDGNGRVGRLLITLMLCERRVLPDPLLYLSAYFEANRQEYYDHLLDVSRRGSWNNWFRYVARGVAEQARDAILRIQRLEALLEHYQQLLREKVRSVAPLKLVEELFASPFITVKRAGEVMAVSPKSANQIVRQFEELGILRETTGQARYRIYCADEVLNLLDNPLSDSPASR